MNWRRTEFEDLGRIVLPDEPPEMDMRSMLTDSSESRAMLRENARTWTDGGTVLAIVGVAPMWKGVGTVWTLMTDEARSHGVALTRGVLRFITGLHAEGYWRLQATVIDGNIIATQWLWNLGFIYEGTMPGYGPDKKTHHQYARVEL